MEFNGKSFEAIIATPGCGKTFLCEKYPNKFVDVDELSKFISWANGTTFQKQIRASRKILKI